MNTKEMIEVMQAYVDGKQIQIRLSISNDKWEDSKVIEPNWNWYKCEYRVKPELKYRPLNNDEMKALVGKRVIHKENEYIHIVASLYTYATGWKVLIGKNTWSSIMLLHKFTYEDGTPIGVLE